MDCKMMNSRKALISNLNYVHLQHVSLGVHLSMRSEMMESPLGQEMGLKDVPAHHHHYKDSSDPALVDANSNDPSVPCQCCDQHSSHAETMKYNLEAIMCEDYLSPDELPLSPLSPSSPSTDSSSSSDFTLDDSPVSMYYKEYAHDDLDTPDQQPDIIPLDVETIDDSIDPSNPTANISRVPENPINGNMEDVPFIDWSSDTILDGNCNALVDTPPPDLPSLSSEDPNSQLHAREKEDDANANQTEVPQWPLDGGLLPHHSVLGESSTLKKTITSFHELAQKRRKSGGPPQLKKDRSDWLIVFSPDVEQPPVNELTASAFYHGLVMPPAQPLPEGKEVTTFRELRYRNSINKQISQQAKANGTTTGGAPDSTEGVTNAAEVQVANSSICSTENQNLLEIAGGSAERRPQEGKNEPLRAIPIPNMRLQQLGTPEAPQRQHGTLLDSRPAMTVHVGAHQSPISIMYSRKEEPPKEKEAGGLRRGLADGGDRRGLEGGAGEPLMADGGGDFLQRHMKGLLIPIGSSVDRIISHFNGSRNQVQKAQLGDSRVTPKLGYLVLHSLCPSLSSLLGDGLKPFRKDVIIGRRRLSPWNVVEASVQSGPESLRSLFHNVSRLQQLRDPQRRLNAFISGLLNTKQLDIWVSHLHQISDQLSSFYLPAGFLPLAASSCPALREELLVTLQPLAALTFHMDLLFEHHHLPLQDPPSPHNAPAASWGVPPLQHILDLGGWLAHNLTGNVDRDRRAQPPSGGASSSDPQRGGVVGPTDGAEVSYGNQHVSSPGDGIKNCTETPQGPPSKTAWWGQLSRAPRLCTPTDTLTSFRKLKGTPDPEQSQPEQHSSHVRRLPQEPPHERPREAGRRSGGPTAIGRGEDSAREAGGPPVHGGLPSHASQEKGGWLGQLFGATSAHSRDVEARTVTSRRPSSWLPPHVNVLSLLRRLPPPEREESFPAEDGERPRSDSKPERSLRALCDHNASGEAQLSFRKGDVLQLLGTLDEDWIQCRRGTDTGLVPVGYTSLIL